MILHDMLEISTGPYFGRRNPPGLLTGIDAVDSGINGLQAGALHVLSAPNCIGATTLLVNMCLEVSQNAGIAFVTEEGKEDTGDDFVRLRNELPYGSDLVFDLEMQARLSSWVRYPVAILGNTRTLEELQANVLATMMEVNRSGFPLNLLVVDCPLLLTPDSPSYNTAIPYLAHLARSERIAVIVNVQAEWIGENGEQIWNEFGISHKANDCRDSTTSMSAVDSEHQVFGLIDHQIILRIRTIDGQPLGDVAGNRVLRVVDRKHGHNLIQVLTIIPSAGICEETALRDDPDPEQVSFDP